MAFAKLGSGVAHHPIDHPPALDGGTRRKLVGPALDILVVLHLQELARGKIPAGKVRAFYPQAQVTSTSYAKVDSTLPYGSLHSPGVYRTTLTAPRLFHNYLLENFEIILGNHGGTIEIRESQTPIPVHFAVALLAAGSWRA